MLSFKFFKNMWPKSFGLDASLFFLALFLLLFFAGQLLVAYAVSAWDRSRVENTISQSLNRQVHLGKINWRIDFKGLGLDTEEIAVQNKDNTPFFHCDKATILFGIIPLLRGQLRIKHLDLQRPQAWFERLTNTEWNFSDFPQADVFSKFADCKVTDGDVQLIDIRPKTNERYARTEVRHIQFEVHRPFGKYFWPFALSAEMVQPEGLCKIDFKGSGSGTLNEWHNCHYLFELVVQNLAPIRLVNFFDSIPETEGVLDINIKGSGVPSSEFKGSAGIRTNNIVVKPRGAAPWKISNTITNAEIVADKKQIAWKNFSLKVGESEVKSNGQLHDWQSAAPKYEAEVDSRIEELAGILKNIEIGWVKKLVSLPQDLALYGKLNLSGSVMPYSGKSTTQVVLHNAQVKLNDKDVIASALNGAMSYGQDGLHIDQIKGSLKNGVIDAGDFELDGHMGLGANKAVDLKLSGHNLDVTKVKTVLQSLGMRNQLFADQLITGKIKDIKLHLFGTEQKPRLALQLVPEDIIYQPVDAANAIHLAGVNTIKYENDVLDLDKVNIKGTATRCSLSAKLSHCITQPRIERISVSDAILDLKEISIDLLSKKNPDIVRQSFKKVLDNYGISALQGKLTGGLSGKNTNGVFNLDGNGSLQAVQFKKAGQTIMLASGNFSTNATNDLLLQNVNCSINKSIFTINGRFLNFNNFDTLHPRLTVKGQVYYPDIAPFISAPIVEISINKPITVDAFISDHGASTTIKFSAGLVGDAIASVTSGGTIYNKSPGVPISIDGTMTSQGSNLNIERSQIVIGQLTLQATGTVTNIMGVTPGVDMKVRIQDPTPIQPLLNIIGQGPSSSQLGEVTGNIRGGFHIVGPSNALTVRGGGKLFAVGIPKLNVANITGNLKMTTVQSNANQDEQNQVISVQLDKANIGSLLIENINGSVSCFLNQTPALIKVDDLKGNLADGTLTASADLKLSSDLPFNTSIQINGMDANKVTQQLGGKKNELTGKVDINLTLAGNAKSSQEFVDTLSGSGSFHAINGWIEKLSELQIKLEEANILGQGLLGLRFSNIWSTTNPQENGEFLSTGGQFRISNGIVQLDKIIFDGEEMKLLASGTLNLHNKRILLHATGDIPRAVGEGFMAKVTSLMSIATLADFVSKQTHFNATIPVIGGFSSKAVRLFAFIVDGSLDQPNTIASSIASSFHWLGNPPPTKVSGVQNRSAQ